MNLLRVKIGTQLVLLMLVDLAEDSFNGGLVVLVDCAAPRLRLICHVGLLVLHQQHFDKAKQCLGGLLEALLRSVLDLWNQIIQ